MSKNLRNIHHTSPCALKRKRHSKQDTADDIDGVWPPRPAKMRRTLVPQASSSDQHLAWGDGDMTAAGASSSQVRPANHQQAPTVYTVEQHREAQQMTPTQVRASQAQRQAPHPVFESRKQGADVSKLLHPHQQPTIERTPFLYDERIPSFRKGVDPRYDAIAGQLQSRDDPFSLPGWKHHRPEEMGSNTIEDSHPLHGVVRPFPPLFEETATKFKESLHMQQQLTQKGMPWGRADLREAGGMNETLLGPGWTGGAYNNVRTGDIAQDEDFKQFVKGARLLHREGEKPDMNDFHAVKEYLRKPSKDQL